jgi:hypothetical protein
MVNLHDFVMEEKQRIAKVCEQQRNDSKGVTPRNGKRYATRKKIAEIKAAKRSNTNGVIVLHQA